MEETKVQPGAPDLEFYPGGAALISRDGKERILAVNSKLCGYYECPDEQAFLALTGGSYQGMVDPDEYVPLQDIYDQHKEKTKEEEGFWFFHFLMQTRQGHFCRLEGLVAPYEDSRLGPVWTLYLIRSRFRGETMEMDRVTGLLGRYAFYKKISEIAEQDRKNGCYGRFVPLYVNLTNFKLYNSDHGLAAGDALLRKLAGHLRRHFPEAVIAHLSADNFALLVEEKDLIRRITDLEQDFKRENDDPSVLLKAGFLAAADLPRENLANYRQAFDKAKIAADSIKQDASRQYAIYTEAMGRQLSDAAYVLRHFDEALEKGYIQLYFQPIVRTLTGKLCSVEALARWNDPQKGLLTPGRFIPVLEKNRLITRLDLYMLEQVAKLLRFQQENHRPLLPISINLSRVDFDQVDPVLEVEAIVQKYQLPRNLLHIEITETALAQDCEKLQKAIQRFRQAGYECWLDDFGSGYSSLNQLQRFQFDTIKLDTAFQKPFNQESRKILRSLVLMAKNLGVHTLAEGVETKEQVDFLTSIGCEKLQGYYFGKPLPYEEGHQFCYEQGLESETTQEAAIMEMAGQTNLLTGRPLSVFWYDGGSKIANLWENPAFQQVLGSFANVKKYRPGQVVDLKKFSVLREFEGLLKRAVRSGREESLTYVDNGSYVKANMQVLAGCSGMYTGKAELYNLSIDSSFQTTQRLDDIARHLLQMYDGPYLYRSLQDEIEVISSLQIGLKKGDRLSRAQWAHTSLAIHPEDQQRFLTWTDPRSLMKQARESGRLLAVGMFRMRLEDGNYVWREFDALSVGQETDGNLFFCIKDTPMEWIRDRETVLPLFLRSYGLKDGLKKAPVPCLEGSLLSAMRKSCQIKFFWKDSQRRFLGASQAFLDYFGLPDETALLGKTDEDMGWHIDTEPFKGEEEKVLQKGIFSRNIVGKCLARGQLHTIQTSKAPMYDGNKIVGLVGYFHDLEKARKLSEKDRELGLIDEETGLTDFRGMMLTGQEYFNHYEQTGEDFVGLLFHIPELEKVSRLYGKDFRRELLTQVSHTLLAFAPYEKALGHLGDGRFLCLLKLQKGMVLDNKRLQLSSQIHAIQKVQGHSITLYLQQAKAHGSETGSLDSFLRLLAERLEEAEKEQYGQSVYIGDRIAIERIAFDTADQNVMLSDPDTYEVLYINKAGLEDLGLPADYDYRGKHCHKLLCGLDYPCDNCPRALLRRDRFYTRAYHNRQLGRDYLINHILVPWRGKNCHLEVAINLRYYMEDEIKENEYIFQEMAVNDAIELSMRANTPEEGIQALLARTGELLECEKLCVFEEMPDGTLCNTYEWCREGIPSTKARLQKVPRSEAQFLYDRFDRSQIAIIENVPHIMMRYGQSKPRMPGLKSLISGHLTFAGRSLGFTEVINPSEKVLKEASPLLATLTRFAAILFRNRDMVRRLSAMSYVDAMTDTRNRRAFQEYVQKLPPHKDTVFIFGDMNGLKAINDQYGHKAGDEAIRTAAEIMKSLAGEDNVFRMGGDEFLMIVSGLDRKGTAAFIEKLKARFQQSGISMAFGATVSRTPIQDIDTLISEADARMYHNKKHPRA
jgi:diguanylate cyclase (GGDEF)-like protein